MNWTTHYWDEFGVEILDPDERGFVPAIGDGFLDGSTRRWRVVDRWFSIDHHGHFADGWHVFLAPVVPGSEDDRLKRIAPDYFQSDV